jgi:hypothetical protein
VLTSIESDRFSLLKIGFKERWNFFSLSANANPPTERGNAEK